MTQTRYKRGRHPLDVYVERGGKDSAMKEYLGGFAVSNCPGCGGLQYTLRGEPVACPECVAGKTSLPGPSALMWTEGGGEGGR